MWNVFTAQAVTWAVVSHASTAVVYESCKACSWTDILRTSGVGSNKVRGLGHFLRLKCGQSVQMYCCDLEHTRGICLAAILKGYMPVWFYSFAVQGSGKNLCGAKAALKHSKVHLSPNLFPDCHRSERFFQISGTPLPIRCYKASTLSAKFRTCKNL